MKRRDVLQILDAAGFTFKEGGDHTKVYRAGRLVTTVPRHREVNELTVGNIEKRTGIRLRKGDKR